MSARRLLMKAGAKRVSPSAQAELARALREFGAMLAAEAVKAAERAGRRTVRAEDVEAAALTLIKGWRQLEGEWRPEA